MFPEITNVFPLKSYRLLVEFDSGSEYRLMNFEPRLSKEVFAPLRDPRLFRRVKYSRRLGTAVWPNGLDIAPEVLFEEGVPIRL